jgi:uncharacterized protein
VNKYRTMLEAPAEERVGDWMQLCSGGQFYPLDPRPEEICIEDIAGALSRICRFGGHTREFYSVAQHSVHVSYICAREDALWGLLHDGSEAYLGDMIRPLKRQECMRAYVEAEMRVQRAICRRFKLPFAYTAGAVTLPPSVHHADEVMLATEARDLLGNEALERWSSIKRVVPLAVCIEAWSPAEARRRFLSRFLELAG